jgi:hypothetical protein
MALGQGETITVSTNVAGAMVNVDRKEPAASGSSQSRFVRVPRGTRYVRAMHRDFVLTDQSIYVGLFGSHEYRVTMAPLMLPFRVLSAPQAEVLLNGKPIGTADDKGVLTVSVASGEYVIEARAAGYEGRQERVEIRGTSPQCYLPLAMTEAKRQELAAQRERATALVEQARTLFSQRNYNAALKAADDAIKLAPQDNDARRLRDQIAETIRILQQ